MIIKFVDEPQNDLKELGAMDVMEVSFPHFGNWLLLVSLSLLVMLIAIFLVQTVYQHYWLKK